MKIKFFILFMFLACYIYPQQDKFIIGADWLNSTASDWKDVNLSSNYWNLIEEFGLNFGTLNLNENITDGVTKINTQLSNAYNHGVEIELLPIEQRYVMGRPRRWMFQIEGTYDFNNHQIQGDEIREEDMAETHWSKVKDEDEQSIPNYIHLETTKHNSGYIASDLVQKDVIPDGSTYYVKIRIRKTGFQPGTQPVVKVLVINTANGLPQEQVIRANQLTRNVWQEIDAFSFSKTAIGPSIANPEESNIIISEAGLLSGKDRIV